MAVTAALDFITMTTGNRMLSPRSEVDDFVVTKLIEAINADGNVGSELHVETEIFDGFATFFMATRGMALSRCFLCWRQDRSDYAWRVLSDFAADQPAPIMPGIEQPRAVPWLAVIIDHRIVDLVDLHGLDFMAEKMMILGDAERCIAWALIEQAGAGS